jgi:ATP-dependent helicase/nuclease subunit A
VTRDAIAALREADDRARDLAQSVFDRPLVVEAGAGTGKTTALVARVLAWSFGPGWETSRSRMEPSEEGVRDDRIAAQVLRGVVAITFTEKAAAEMSERIGDALSDIEQGDSPSWLRESAFDFRSDEMRQRARALRGALEHLVVQTIHAYCRRILVENALDAGLHPNLEIDADGSLQANAVRAAMEAALESAYADAGDSPHLVLAARGYGPREIEQAVIALLASGCSEEALRADPATPDRIAALVARLRSALENFQAIAGEDLQGVGGVAGVTALYLERALAAVVDRPFANRTDFESFVSQLREDGWDPPRGRLVKWRGGTFTKGESAALGDRTDLISARAEELIPLMDHVASIDLEGLDAARAAVAGPLAAADAQLRSAGVLTFSALLGEVRSLLRDRPEVAARIRAGIDQLLVDEFQDTDECQCEIVRRLAFEGVETERPSLFIVGDPKQSIYGWRKADLAAYSAFVAEVCELGGERVRLSVNFRSVPKVLDEVERVISPVMEEAPGIQPEFQPLVACEKHENEEGFCASHLRPVEYWMPTAWQDDGSGLRKTAAGEATQIEAAALARELRALHDEHRVPWQSIGVLFRSRGDWEVYLPALRQAGIPYAAEGDRSYYRRREIIDVACLVRCVLDPNDQLALIAYLRSVAVGVPDAAWIPLWTRGFPDRIANLEEPRTEPLAEIVGLIRDAASAVPADIPGIERISGWEENLISAVVDLAHLRASFAAEASDEFIEKLRTRTLLEVTESSRYLGAWRCANLERFFREMAADLEGGQSPHELLRRLRVAVATEKVAEEGRPVDLMADAVRVMTVHGAKGLGFEHVYLMQLHKGMVGGPNQRTETADWLGEFEYRLLDMPTLAWDRVSEERERTREAERVRLLYVAMTRAEQRLVLTGLWSDHQQRSSRGQSMELVQPRIESTDGLEAWLLEEARRGASDFFDAFGVRWSLPALDAGEAVNDFVAGTTSATLPTQGEIEDASHKLIALRELARARMSRPMSEAASARHREVDEDHLNGAFDHRSAAPTHDAGIDSRAIGVAVHRALEDFDFDADAETEIARQRDALAGMLSGSVPVDCEEQTVQAGAALWDRIAGGRLFGRLRAMSDQIVSRELSVLGPPSDDAGPVGFYAGTIDLVYRDLDNDQFVVVDYKTDAIAEPEALQQRADTYAEQGSVYRHALQGALDLSYTPRFELWFLDADEIFQY